MGSKHRRRSGWNSGGNGKRRRWVGAKWGGAWRGVTLSQPTGGVWERRELPLSRQETDFGVHVF